MPFDQDRGNTRLMEIDARKDTELWELHAAA